MRNLASGTPAHIHTPRFTPGPWRRLGHRFIVAAHGAELPVCQVLPGGVGVEQADANERLIAAAPDLFAALQSALVVVGGCNADGAFDDQERAVRIALAIALEGRS